MPVAGDDWYQRRRRDAEGLFFRGVADQGPRTAGGATRQGVYVLSASGKLLAYASGVSPVDDMRAAVLKGLEEWSRLPESERSPGGVHVGESGPPDPRYARALPPGGLVVNVYTRGLERRAGASWEDARALGDGPSRDRLWLTEAEWRSLVPANPELGDALLVPAPIAERILRFHLVDNTRGEPRLWPRDQIRTSHLALTVEHASAAQVRLRLDGAALLASHADKELAVRGYDARLLGYLDYDRARGVFTRFDIVAVGERWTDSAEVTGASYLRGPLGVAFELGGDAAADRLPPQAARNTRDYFGDQKRP